MSSPSPVRSGHRLDVLLICTALMGVLGACSWSGSLPGAALSGSSMHTDAVASTRPAPDRVPRQPSASEPPRPESLSLVDGEIPSGVTVFDDGYPAVANLDPALLGALRRAASTAAQADIEFTVNSGWRSPAYQERLLDEAVSTYGSRTEAARWVATPETSAHVTGDAADIGPTGAAIWLSEHGAGYGLCQVYRNEPWHFELRPEAVDDGCPAQFADPTQDPRMQP